MSAKTKPLAILAALLFWGVTFVPAWSHLETDFPNYYTAARLVREGKALPDFYDWTWFKTQLDLAGIDRQLGAYTPQTPLTMLPFFTVSNLPPLAAKRAWLLMNPGFLVATIFLLVRVTRFRWDQLVLLTFGGFGALRTNFLYGQYYVFLLFLLTLGFYFLQRGRNLSGGSMFGACFALKLYGGPFGVYFLARRNRRALAGWIVALAIAGAVSIFLFGWRDSLYYVTNLLPRFLESGSVDPFVSGNPTVNTLLHRIFMRDAELHPNPMVYAPWVFHFLNSLFTVCVAALAYLTISSEAPEQRRQGFAWFLITVMLMSMSIASYAYILLLLPVAILIETLPTPRRWLVLGCYILLCSPFPRFSIWLLPKLWVLIILFAIAGIDLWRRVPVRNLAVAVSASVVMASLLAWHAMAAYEQEPGRRYTTVQQSPADLYASWPMVTSRGTFYQAMGTDRYELRWQHDGRTEAVAFDGDVMRPFVAAQDGSIHFDLVNKNGRAPMKWDPTSGAVTPDSIDSTPTEAGGPIASPDGRWLASVVVRMGRKQIWIRNVADGTNGASWPIAGGNCDSFAPAWELDSRSLLFASDCGRAYGLPTLYRARLTEVPGLFDTSAKR